MGLLLLMMKIYFDIGMYVIHDSSFCVGKGVLLLNQFLKTLVNIIHGTTRNILGPVKFFYNPFSVIF